MVHAVTLQTCLILCTVTLHFSTFTYATSLKRLSLAKVIAINVGVNRMAR